MEGLEDEQQRGGEPPRSGTRGGGGDDAPKPGRMERRWEVGICWEGDNSQEFHIGIITDEVNKAFHV